MRISLLLLACAAVVGFNCGPAPETQPERARNEHALIAEVTCVSARTNAVVLEGMAEIYPRSGEDLASDRAVVHDWAGHAYAATGFGLTGEAIILVPGRSPAMNRLELGQSVHEGADLESLAQCFFSKVSSESRLLTAADVDKLGIDAELIGANAEIETSIHGIIWL
jgi:hypothetical protein